MYHRIYVISFYAETIANFLLLVIALILGFRRAKFRYMRSFPVYCIGNFGFELVMMLKPASQPTMLMLFSIFELLYFSYFLTRLIASNKVSRVIWALDMAYVVAYGLQRGLHFTSAEGGVFMVMEGCILITGCLVYYKELFGMVPTTDLAKESAFWVVTGILIYFLMLIPTILFDRYYFYLKMMDAVSAIYSVNNYAVICSYVLFTIAILCNRQKLS